MRGNRIYNVDIGNTSDHVGNDSTVCKRDNDIIFMFSDKQAWLNRKQATMPAISRFLPAEPLLSEVAQLAFRGYALVHRHNVWAICYKRAKSLPSVNLTYEPARLVTANRRLDSYGSRLCK